MTNIIILIKLNILIMKYNENNNIINLQMFWSYLL